MSGRLVAETAVVILITAGLIIAGFAALELSDGGAPADAFFSAGPRTALGFAGIGFGLWALATIVGGVLARNRSRRARLLISILAGIAAGVVNLVVWGIVGVTGGGWSMLAVAFALIGSVVLVVAVVVASLLTYLVAFRRAA